MVRSCKQCFMALGYRLKLSSGHYTFVHLSIGKILPAQGTLRYTSPHSFTCCRVQSCFGRFTREESQKNMFFSVFSLPGASNTMVLCRVFLELSKKHMLCYKKQLFLLVPKSTKTLVTVFVFVRTMSSL